MVKALPELWAAQPEYAVNNQLGFVRSCTDTGETYIGPGYKIHIPIIDVIPVTSVGAAMAAGVGTSSPGTPTEGNTSGYTPTVIYAAVYFLEDVSLTMAYGDIKTYTPALSQTLYQQIDVDGLSQFAGLTHSQTDTADFTAANCQALIAKIMNGGGDKVQLGQLDGWYHPLKWDAIMSDASFYSGAVRGEDNAPAKTGTLGMAWGVNFNFTANVQTSTTLRNVIVGKKALILVRKNRPKIEMERSDLVTKVVASTMYKFAPLHPGTGGQHIITTLT
jgi:hypothetical protein